MAFDDTAKKKRFYSSFLDFKQHPEAIVAELTRIGKPWIVIKISDLELLSGKTLLTGAVFILVDQLTNWVSSLLNIAIT